MVFALPGVSTGSGVERAIISLECIPAESPTILQCKWELSGLDWIQARATQGAEEVLYRGTGRSHKILLWHYNWVNTVPVTLHIDMQADITVINEKQFESLKGTSRLRPTKVIIRSYSGDGMGPVVQLVSFSKNPLPNMGSGTARDKGLDQRVWGCLYWYWKTKRCDCEATCSTQCPMPGANQEQRRKSIPLEREV